MVGYRVLAAVGFAAVVTTSPAHADRAAADRCAASLQPASKALYQASLAEVIGGMSPKDALTEHARAMVMSGQLSRADARPAAEAAGPCLAQLR